MGLFSSLSVGHIGQASPTAAGTAGTLGPAWSAVGPQSTHTGFARRMLPALHHPALPSVGNSSRMGRTLHWGKTVLPVIALESPGILTHKINAGAITTNLFYAQRAMLGTSPGTGCEIQGAGGSWTPWRAAPCGPGHPHRTSATPQRSCVPLQPQCKT